MFLGFGEGGKGGGQKNRWKLIISTMSPMLENTVNNQSLIGFESQCFTDFIISTLHYLWRCGNDDTLGPNVDDDHGVDAKKSQKGFFPSSFQDVFNFFPPLSNVDDDIGV